MTKDIKLIENNASVGADIALEYSKLLNNAQQSLDTQPSSNIDNLLHNQRNLERPDSEERSARNATFAGTKRPVSFFRSLKSLYLALTILFHPNFHYNFFV